MKKKMLGLTLTAASVLTLAGLAVSTNAGSLLHANATVDELWSHYDGVAAGVGERGIKEYWVSCSTHESRFEAPTDGTIQEKGAPSREFIDGLAADDSRLLEAYNRVYNYDTVGGASTGFVKNAVVTGSAVTSLGVENSNCLAIDVKTGDFQFGFTKEYLNAVFADSAVKAVAADMKSTTATANWRAGVNGAELGNQQPFEGYGAGSGISTNWKTFYFTRAMYEAFDTTGYMFKGAIGGEGTIYVDNVRGVYYDVYNNCSKLNFETGGFEDKSTETKGTMSVRFGNNVEGLLVDGAGVTAGSGEMSYTVKDEGNRSFKFTKKSGYLAVYLSTKIINAIPGDYVLLDMYSTTGINSTDSNKGITDGQNKAFNKATPGNKWFTIALNKSTDITTDGRILTMGGSAAGDIYFDNIRGVNELDEVETGYAFKAGQYGYYLGYKTGTTETDGNTIRDVNKNYTFMVNGANLVSAEITSEKVSTNSTRSVKYTYSAKGYCALFINANLLNDYLPKGYSIAFDIWMETSFTGGTAWGDLVNPKIGQWQTVTLNASMFEKNGSNVYNGRFSTASFNGAGSFYIDNVKLVPPTVA